MNKYSWDKPGKHRVKIIDEKMLKVKENELIEEKDY